MSVDSKEIKEKSEALSFFLKSLPSEKGYEDDLITLIENIGNGLFEISVRSFLELPKAKQTKMVELLGDAVLAKALKIENIKSFWEGLFKNSSFFPETGKDFLMNFADSFDELFELKAILKDCISEFFKYSLEKNSDATFEPFYECIRSSCDRILGRSDNFVIEIYKELDHENQKKFLTFFVKFYCKQSEINPENIDLFYKLRLANSKFFQEIFNSLTQEIQYQVKQFLYKSKNELIEHIKKRNFDGAVEIFVEHPLSLEFLNKFLDKIDTKTIEDNLIPFLDKLLKMDYKSAFLVIRLCSENKHFSKQYGEIFESILKKYLTGAAAYPKETMEDACRLLLLKYDWVANIANVYKGLNGSQKRALMVCFLNLVKQDNLSISLIKALQLADPVVFDEILKENDEAFQKKIESYLSQKPASFERDSKIAIERSILEERGISRFEELLEIPNNFSKAMSSIDSAVEKGADDLAKIFIILYFKKAIELNKVDKINNHLFSHLTFGSYVLKAYGELSKEEQMVLIPLLLKEYGSRFNAASIQKLREINPDIFDSGLKAVTDKILKEKIEKLLVVPPLVSSSVSSIMEQFTMPHRRITNYAARLVCSEINKRKIRYAFTPTVLHNKDFQEYLEFFIENFKKNGKVIKERFVLTGDHWIAGELRISEDEFDSLPKIELVILDSLGGYEPKTRKILDKHCLNRDITVYISNEKRQHSEVGCAMFALRDLQELFTIESYLPAEYENNLFTYLENHKGRNLISLKQGGKISLATLPIRFMRTEQSRNLLEHTIPERSEVERTTPVNKKGRIMSESVAEHFKEVGGKSRNLRLEYITGKMADNVFDYLFRHKFNLLHIESEMIPFSLKGRKNLEGKERKEEREVEAARDEPLMLRQFDLAKTSTKKPSDPEKKAEVEQECNLYSLRNILQEKFKYNVSDLKEIVEYLSQKYMQGHIKTTDHLKQAMKAYLKFSMTYDELRGQKSLEVSCIDNSDNGGYLISILEKLSLLVKMEPNAEASSQVPRR